MPTLNTIIIIEFSLPFRIGPPKLHFYELNLVVKKDGKIVTPGTPFAVKCNYTLFFDVNLLYEFPVPECAGQVISALIFEALVFTGLKCI